MKDEEQNTRATQEERESDERGGRGDETGESDEGERRRGKVLTDYVSAHSFTPSSFTSPF